MNFETTQNLIFCENVYDTVNDYNLFNIECSCEMFLGAYKCLYFTDNLTNGTHYSDDRDLSRSGMNYNPNKNTLIIHSVQRVSNIFITAILKIPLQKKFYRNVIILYYLKMYIMKHLVIKLIILFFDKTMY